MKFSELKTGDKFILEEESKRGHARVFIKTVIITGPDSFQKPKFNCTTTWGYLMNFETKTKVILLNMQ